MPYRTSVDRNKDMVFNDNVLN